MCQFDIIFFRDGLITLELHRGVASAPLQGHLRQTGLLSCSQLTKLKQYKGTKIDLSTWISEQIY